MPSRRHPSPLGAGFRSVLIPGWGQLATESRTIGKTLVFMTGLMAIAALTAFLFVEPVELAAWLANPDVLLGVVVFDLVLALVRLYSTEHAWWAGGGQRWVAALFLAVIVAIPHVAVAWVGLETRGSLVNLFPARRQLAAPTSTTSASVTTSTTIPIELSPIVSAPGQYGDDDLDIVKGDPWRPFGEERLNILLLGGDAGPGRIGLRTDTMMVASIHPITGDAALIGIPRNFGGVTLSDGTSIPVTQLGHVYGWGTRHPDTFGGPDPGANAVRDAIQNITGLEIDYFVLVDLTGFADVVDAFGGVSLDVVVPVDGPLYDVETGRYEMVRIPAGHQRLDGGHALAYARARYGSSDYVRMGRQRCILASMAAQADLLSLFPRIDALTEVIEANLTTDLPVDLIPELIRLTPRISAGSIRMVGFDASWGSGSTIDGKAIPDLRRIRQAVRLTIDDPNSSLAAGATTADTGC